MSTSMSKYIDIIDSDSEDGDSKQPYRKVAAVGQRQRRSKKGKIAQSSDEEEWQCEDYLEDSSDDDDDDNSNDDGGGGKNASKYASSLRQRISQRQQGAKARGSYKEMFDGDDDDSVNVGRQQSRRTRGSRHITIDEDEDGDDDNSGDTGNLKMPATDVNSRNDEQIVDNSSNVKISTAAVSSSSSSLTSSLSSTESSLSRTSCPRPKKNDGVSSESIKKYIQTLQNGVKKRTFPLSQIPKEEKISTGRTIKPLKAWKGHWAALREFLQNTIDHLHLMNGVSGRRQDCVQMNVTPKNRNSSGVNHGQDLASISFTCDGEDICRINISNDQVVIDQLYTYPIASRALDTGVPDCTKASSNSQAGGFGDGFKTAAVALIANSSKNSKKNEFKSLKWTFYAMKEHTKIEWDFVGSTREKVATFEKCQVLQVNINKSSMKPSEEEKVLSEYSSSSVTSKGRGCAGCDYIMRQTIMVKNIGKSFLNEAIPRLIVFWDLNEASLLSMSRRSARMCGGDFIGPINLQPPLFSGALGNLKMNSGVYVKGIYVRPTRIKDTIMAFYGDRLEVSGRDRNEIDEEELIQAVTELIGRCNNIKYLNELLSPLRGDEQIEENGDGIQGSKRRKRVTNDGANGSKSWLLQSPRFFNRVIEIQKDYVLNTVFRIPRGALFVSKKTTDSKDPFIKWSANFLEKHGAPLIPIAKGANRFLFEEVDRYELTEKCVSILKQLERGTKNTKGKPNQKQNIFQKFLTFVGIGRAKVFFSPEIAVAFVHENSIFIPEVSLSRDIIVKVLNVCHSQLEGSNGENYSCLLQSIFEKVPPTSADFDIKLAIQVIDRAKEVLKEQRNFLVNANNITDKASRSVTNNAKEDKAVRSIISIDSDDDSSLENRKPSTKPSSNEQLISTNFAHLEEQIKNVTKRVTSKKRTQDGGDKPNPIIPESLFEDDNAGNDVCLRPSSSLVKMDVSTAFGGDCIWFDKTSAAQIRSGKFNLQNQRKIALMRNVLEEAKRVVCESIPSTKVLLQRVMAGYDAKNDTYEAFCNGHCIIVNLFAYTPKLISQSSSLSSHRTLIHDFVITVTHELAHFLEPRAGHGPVWRDTHMKMMMGVMKYLETSK